MHIPSLQTLRAFEAAGRHQSYSGAADELGLTHGAISHRIRDLEGLTGLRLFERNGNRMVPTSEGHRLLVQVRYALGLLEGVFASARLESAARLVVSVLPSFASHWLVPRVGDFRSSHPDVDLVLQPSSDLEQLGSGLDCAVRYGPGSWPDVQSTFICGETLSPVCSPAYLARHPIGRPADLLGCTLLRNPWQPWAKWLRAAGVSLAEPKAGPEYSTELGIQAAMAGEGVLLARGLLAADQIRAGTLVRPFSEAVTATYDYFLVRPLRGTSSAVDEFAAWLQPKMAEEAAAARAGLTILP